MSEILFLAVLALVVIGPKELPQLARTLGRFLNELKRTSNILTDDLKQHVRLDDFNIDAAITRSKNVKAQEKRPLPKPDEDVQDDYGDDYDEIQAELKKQAETQPQQMELSEHHDNSPSADNSSEKKKS